MSMKINEIEYNYKYGLPYHVEICSITRMAPHYHDESLELIFCLDGSVNFAAGMQRGTLVSGQIFSIDCEDIHYLYSDEPNTVMLFHMDLKHLPIPHEILHYTCFACESTHCFPYQEKAMSCVKDSILTLSRDYFSESGDEVQSPENAGRLKSEFLVERLLDTLFRYFNYYNYDNQDNYMNPELFDRFYSIVMYCAKNYQSKITLEEVAEYTHISKNYFSQHFGKSSFGNFSYMLKEIRCFKAERLFLTTKLPNSEISFMCGFSDPKYMYSAFRQLWGCTPKEHRRRFTEYMKATEDVLIYKPADSLGLIDAAIVRWHLDRSRQGDFLD